MAVPWAVAGARVPSGREIAVGARDALAGYTSCPVTKASDDDATTTREINASASTTLVQRRLLHPLCSVRAFPCQILSTRSGSLVALVGIRLVVGTVRLSLRAPRYSSSSSRVLLIRLVALPLQMHVGNSPTLLGESGVAQLISVK
ncbi:hypothetical protein SEVIR_7G255450v4 [Setaria viridis]